MCLKVKFGRTGVLMCGAIWSVGESDYSTMNNVIDQTIHTHTHTPNKLHFKLQYKPIYAVIVHNLIDWILS